jgi:hypothetical protein
MIKARKGTILLLGLSDENMKRLAKDQPIKFKLQDLRLDPAKLDQYEVIIFNGRTEDSIALSIQELSKPAN